MLSELILHIRRFVPFQGNPIDECFKLIDIIRMQWQGFSGGLEMWREIAKFLEHRNT
jgi:uncharacterized protein DUF5947